MPLHPREIPPWSSRGPGETDGAEQGCELAPMPLTAGATPQPSFLWAGWELPWRAQLGGRAGSPRVLCCDTPGLWCWVSGEAWQIFRLKEVKRCWQSSSGTSASR